MSNKNHSINKIEKRIFLFLSFLLGFFLIFLFFYHINDIEFYAYGENDCGLKAYFHLYCPGCGGTRALDAFLHGNFLHSFCLHPTIMYLFAFFLSYYIPTILHLSGITQKPIYHKTYLYILIGLLVLIILFFIGRNLLLVYAGYDYIGECLPFWS